MSSGPGEGRLRAEGVLGIPQVSVLCKDFGVFGDVD